MGFRWLTKLRTNTLAEEMKALHKQNDFLQQELVRVNAIIASNPQVSSFEKASQLLSELRREILSRVQKYVLNEQWDDCRRDILYVMGNRFGEKRLQEIYKTKSVESDWESE